MRTLADQGIADSRAYAAGIAAFYNELRVNHIPAEHVLTFTLEHMRMLFGNRKAA